MKRIVSILLLTFLISYMDCFAYSLSNAGKQQIKLYESCSLTAYKDASGWSIGYGHHGKDVTPDMVITQVEADRLFAEDVKSIERAANRMLANFNYEFSQDFFDGLCDLIYNCGEGGVRRSEFYNRLKRCRIKNGMIDKSDLHYTIAAVKTMNVSAKGHVVRRYETHKRMLR